MVPETSQSLCVDLSRARVPGLCWGEQEGEVVGVVREQLQDGAAPGEGERVLKGEEVPKSPPPRDREQETAMQAAFCDQGGDRQLSCWVTTDGWWALMTPFQEAGSMGCAMVIFHLPHRRGIDGWPGPPSIPELRDSP